MTDVNGPIVQQLSHDPNIWKVNSRKKGMRDTRRLRGRDSYAKWKLSVAQK